MVLKSHFEPKPVVIAKRFHFYRRNQAPGETVKDFLAELRKLAINCKFGNFLDDALRDILVCGIRNDQAQKKLLSEVDLTLTRALQTALSIEAADARAKEMKEVSQTFSEYHLPAIAAESLVTSRNCADTRQLNATSVEKLDMHVFCLLVDRKERRYQQDKVSNRIGQRQQSGWKLRTHQHHQWTHLALTRMPMDYHCLSLAKPPETALSRLWLH